MSHSTEFFQQLRGRWYLYLPIAVVWALAYVRLFIDPTPRLPLLFNWTGSVPYHLAVVYAKSAAIERGDYIVFAFDGSGQTSYPGLRHQPFFKQVRGLPGDTVSVDGRTVHVNGVFVGVAKRQAFDGRGLAPIEATVIPPGHFYVQGTDANSFDSRYRSSGLVRSDQIIATVWPLF